MRFELKSDVQWFEWLIILSLMSVTFIIHFLVGPEFTLVPTILAVSISFGLFSFHLGYDYRISQEKKV